MATGAIVAIIAEIRRRKGLFGSRLASSLTL